MRVQFKLKYPDNESSGIMLHYSNKIFKHRRFVYGVGETVPVKLWNYDKQRLNLTGAPVDTHGDIKRINKKLETLKMKLLIFMDSNNDVTKESLKAHLDNKTGVTQRNEQAVINRQPDFLKWCYNLIEENAEGWRPSTLSSKKQTVTTLENFSKANKIKLTFEGFDRAIYKKLKVWMRDNQEFSTNTIWKHTKELKALLKEAEREEIKVHSAYRLGVFKASQVVTPKIYLNEAQIEAIRTVDLSDFPKGYETARQMFLLMCYVGMSIGDIQEFRMTDIITIGDKKYLDKDRGKTGTPQLVPIKSKAVPYLKEYKLSEQKVNEYIKDIAEKAKLPKAQEITTHTGRRSFASNSYLANIPELQIMAMTGHKSVKELQRYIRITPGQRAVLTSENPYFND